MNPTYLKLNPIEALRELDVLTPAIENQINFEYKTSASGRAFGAPSAENLMRQLVHVANTCMNEIERNPKDGRTRCQEIIERSFGEKRRRRLTTLNNILAKIAKEVEGGKFVVLTPLPANNDGEGVAGILQKLKSKITSLI